MGSFSPFSEKSFTVINSWDTENSPEEEEAIIEPMYVSTAESNYEKNKKTEVLNFSLDLDDDGKNEKIIIKSNLGFPGDQNTEVYINSDKQPEITEIGSFYSIRTHSMGTFKQDIIELQVQTGQSINTLLYTYRNGRLERVPVSTEKPPSWFGIISRNSPEFKDIDDDGSPELLAYYSFLYDLTRKVEVYSFDGKVFVKVHEYEESVSERKF